MKKQYSEMGMFNAIIVRELNLEIHINNVYVNG